MSDPKNLKIVVYYRDGSSDTFYDVDDFHEEPKYILITGKWEKADAATLIPLDIIKRMDMFKA